MMQGLLEHQFLKSLVAHLPRHPHQLNALLESDAELIQLAETTTLAITTDSIVEEIETGLYTDPFLIGWMTVMVNLSDLAAVGAKPVGLLLAQHIPDDTPGEFLQELQRGIASACRSAETFILGGDTNASSNLQMGATAIGVIDDEKRIMRRGCHAGHLIYCSNPMGEGGAYAFSQIFGRTYLAYQPKARLREGEIVRQYGSACIDSSDGFFPAIATLMQLNTVGVELEGTIDSLLSPTMQAMAKSVNIPPWFFLAGPHGEFELVFSIPPERKMEFLHAARAIEWEPLLIGRASASPAGRLKEGDEMRQIDPFKIANLFEQSGGDPASYVQQLMKTDLYDS